jgi:hypothetical protein
MRLAIALMSLSICLAGCGRKAATQATPVVEDVPKAPPAKTPASDDFTTITPGKAILLEDVRVTIESVKIARASLVLFDEKPKADDRVSVLVAFKVENRSESRKIDYISWQAGTYRATCEVTDTIGNKYKWHDNPSSHHIEGGIFQNPSLYPGKSVKDILAFEPPVEKASAILVTMSGKNVGIKSDFKIRLNKADWNNFRP